MEKEEMKHLKKNLEVALEELDTYEKENEDLKLKVEGMQILIKKLKKELRNCSSNDLGEVVKRLNEENLSLKDQIK